MEKEQLPVKLIVKLIDFLVSACSYLWVFFIYAVLPAFGIFIIFKLIQSFFR